MTTLKDLIDGASENDGADFLEAIAFEADARKLSFQTVAMASFAAFGGACSALGLNPVKVFMSLAALSASNGQTDMDEGLAYVFESAVAVHTRSVSTPADEADAPTVEAGAAA